MSSQYHTRRQKKQLSGQLFKDQLLTASQIHALAHFDEIRKVREHEVQLAIDSLPHQYKTRSKYEMNTEVSNTTQNKPKLATLHPKLYTSYNMISISNFYK